MHFGDKDKVIYEAVLSTAPEFPDEVTQIALEICSRRDEPATVIQRRSDEEERQAKHREEWRKNNPEKRAAREQIAPLGLGSYRQGPMGPAAADGPLRPVPQGFQLAVMESAALNGLISVRPEVAREILLAVCIEEPRRLDPYNNDRFMAREQLGLADWPRGYPAMYWKGPFLRFLQQAPGQGLDAIVRLVNYATEKWLEAGVGPNVSEDVRKEYGLEFEVNGTTVLWLGDGNVFGWHRYLSMHGDTVECALMALEKWLYEEIESRKSITPWVDYLFAQGTSLAFAGVLISVGLRYPGLFLRDLQPLLGNFYLYQPQMGWALGENNSTWRISWSGQSQPVLKLAAEWHEMPHRCFVLRDTEPTLMLQDEGTMKYLSSRKAEWAKIPHGNDKARQDMVFFLARFDPANYTETPQGDGRVLVTMRWPDHLEKIATESQQESQLKMLALGMAIRARRLLEGLGKLDFDCAPQ
jgi:hypothetical protein